MSPAIIRRVNHQPASERFFGLTVRVVEILLSSFQEFRMSELVQGMGFT
ncbi:MAG: hypothetical protein WB680_23160 [Candidatus Acidiferrales bacterium]